MYNKLSKLSRTLIGYIPNYHNDFLTKYSNSSGRIVSLLGYNKIFADAFDKKFGSKAFTIAKWFKEYYDSTTPDVIGDSSFQITIDVIKASLLSPEHVLDALKYYGIYSGPIEEYVSAFVEDFNNNFTNKYAFFHLTLMAAIINNEVSIERYKKLSFKDALNLYNKRNIGNKENTLIKYKDGYRWVNVGKRNESVGEDLSNCGSAGFSSDPDAQLLVLVNKELTAKVIATYKPSNNSIDNVEMKGSQKVDERYYPYVLDLKDKLNCRYDKLNENPKLWTLFNFKIEMKDYYKSEFSFSEVYTFQLNNEIWFNSGNIFIKESELLRFIFNEQKDLNPDEPSNIGYAINRFYKDLDLYRDHYEFYFQSTFEDYINNLKNLMAES